MEITFVTEFPALERSRSWNTCENIGFFSRNAPVDSLLVSQRSLPYKKILQFRRSPNKISSMAVSKSTWRVKLVFIGEANPSLAQTIVRPSGYAENDELICNRGKGRDKSFQWGAGTLALSLFFLKYAAWCSHKLNPLMFEFTGGPGSPADTLETSVLKKCDSLNWAVDMFGTDEKEGRNQLLLVVKKYGSDKAGPDTVFRQGINHQLLPAKALVVTWKGANLTAAKEIEELEIKLLAQWKKAPHAASSYTAPVHLSRDHDSTIEPIIRSQSYDPAIPPEPSGAQFAFSSLSAVEKRWLKILLQITRKRYTIPYLEPLIGKFPFFIENKYVQVKLKKGEWIILPETQHITGLVKIVSTIPGDLNAEDLEKFAPQEPPKSRQNTTRVGIPDEDIQGWVEGLLNANGGIRNLIEHYFDDLRSISKKLLKANPLCLEEWDRVLSSDPHILNRAATKSSFGPILALIRFAAVHMPKTSSILSEFLCNPDNYSKFENAVWCLSQNEILYFITRPRDPLQKVVGDITLSAYSEQKNAERLEALVVTGKFGFYLAAYRATRPTEKDFFEDVPVNILVSNFFCRVSEVFDRPGNWEKLELVLANCEINTMLEFLSLISDTHENSARLINPAKHGRLFGDPVLHWSIVARILIGSPNLLERVFQLSKAMDLRFTETVDSILRHADNTERFIQNAAHHFHGKIEKHRNWLAKVAPFFPEETRQKLETWRMSAS
jgi:hypothetical protein